MPMLLVMPSALLNVPGSRFTVAAPVKPERSSALPVPLSHSVTTGAVLVVKSKNGRIAPPILQWKPNTWPPERGVSVGRPYRRCAARMSSGIGVVGTRTKPSDELPQLVFLYVYSLEYFAGIHGSMYDISDQIGRA